MFKKNNFISKSALVAVVLDIGVIVLAQAVALELIFHSPISLELFTTNKAFLAFNCIFLPLVMYYFDLYNFRVKGVTKVKLIKISVSLVITSVLSTFLAYVVQAQYYMGRWQFFLYWGLVLLGICCTRYFYSVVLTSAIKPKKTIIIGCGDSGRAILETIKGRSTSYIDVIGFLDIDPRKKGALCHGAPVYIQEKSLRSSLEQLMPELVIVAMRRERFTAMINDLIWFAMNGGEIWDVPSVYEHLVGKIPLRFVDETWLLYVGQNIAHSYLKLKRVIDVAIALGGLIVCFPLLLLTALVIKLESGSPTVLNQKRVAQGGNIINLYKFRTMWQSVHKSNDKGTCCNDSRVTPVGRILRKLHIDEIPQLVNVIKGEMSIVGPRAELLEFIQEYWQDAVGSLGALDSVPQGVHTLGTMDSAQGLNRIIPFFKYRFTVPQGITGWSQINAPMLTSSREDMLEKLEYDLYYIKNMSLGLDLIIILKTFKAIILGRGK